MNGLCMSAWRRQSGAGDWPHGKQKSAHRLTDFVLTIGKIILLYSANFVVQPVNSVSLFGLSVSRLKNPVSRSVTTNGRIVVRA